MFNLFARRAKFFFLFKVIYMSCEELKEIENFCGLDCLEEYREKKTQRKRRNDGEKEKWVLGTVV